eukprot:1994736-Prymnesium_polylepis.1
MGRHRAMAAVAAEVAAVEAAAEAAANGPWDASDAEVCFVLRTRARGCPLSAAVCARHAHANPGGHAVLNSPMVHAEYGRQFINAAGRRMRHVSPLG